MKSNSNVKIGFGVIGACALGVVVWRWVAPAEPARAPADRPALIAANQEPPGDIARPRPMPVQPDRTIIRPVRPHQPPPRDINRTSQRPPRGVPVQKVPMKPAG